MHSILDGKIKCNIFNLISIQFISFILVYFDHLKYDMLFVFLLQFLFFLNLFYFVKNIGENTKKIKKQYLEQKKNLYKQEQNLILNNIQYLKDEFKMDKETLNSELTLSEIKDKLRQAMEKYQLIYESKQCENKIIDAILVKKYYRAKKMNIPFFSQVTIPEKLDIDDLDLLSLVSNLIDNSLEANEKVELKKRFICFTAGIKKSNIYICVENAKNDIFSLEKRYTTKKDKENHGYGMQIVKKIVKKYNGYMNIENQDNKIKIDLFLSLLK